jgi:hypothetical protein
MNAETVHTPYSHIWNKYRPVILRLMVDSKNGPQHYAANPAAAIVSSVEE